MPVRRLHAAQRKLLQKVYFFVRRGRLYEIANGKDAEEMSGMTYSSVVVFKVPGLAVSFSSNARVG